MAYRRSLLLCSGFVAMLSPAELKASSINGRIGATSSASIHIEASVAPRLGISGPLSIRQDPVSSAVGPICIWSSAPLRRYTMTLVRFPGAQKASNASARGVSSNEEPLRTAVDASLSAVAHSSIAECNKTGGDVELPLDTGGDELDSNVPVTLILAPE